MQLLQYTITQTDNPRTLIWQGKVGHLDQVTGTSVLRRVTNRWVVLWLVAVAALLVPLILLTLALNDDPNPSQDQTVLDWVTTHGFRGLGDISDIVSAITDAPPAAGIGIAVVALLWLVGATRIAMGFALVGAVVLAVIVVGDLTLGGIVDHVSPTAGDTEDTERSFPSGHVFGAVVFYGFWGFLGIYYGMKPKSLIPMLIVLAAFTLAVGFSRIFEAAHWPSDVAAGYLLGGLWLLVIIPAFLYLRQLSWLSSPKQTVDLTTLGCET